MKFTGGSFLNRDRDEQREYQSCLSKPTSNLGMESNVGKLPMSQHKKCRPVLQDMSNPMTLTPNYDILRNGAIRDNSSKLTASMNRKLSEKQ